ncbi:MAG: selenocysteine-specific translation elongation factor [Phototrophicaceae bacterium]
MRVIGTAGHVDHGKSTLVQALTGIDPDRWQEEKARGLTIDLGFAWFDLPDGETVGIVDVPGHRDFIENMLAGVGGIDAVLLIIAADEGVMPQTREHLAILDLLAIPKGLVILTKVDLIEDDDWLDLIELDIQDVLADTILADADILRVSAKTGEGLDALIDNLSSALNQLPPRTDYNQPRLPVDRIFTVDGFGTVVTGTLSNGTLQIGDTVEFQPSGKQGRVRGLQSYKQDIDVALPGSRVAVNVVGISKDDVTRGDVLAFPSQLQATQLIDVQFEYLADIERPLKHNIDVKFFSGASETLATIRLLGIDELAPANTGWLQLRLRDPIPLTQRDRFILRYPSPAQTIGGGVIVNPHPTQRWKRFDPTIIAQLQTQLDGTPAERVVQAADVATPQKVVHLQKSTTYADDILQAAINEALANNRLMAFSDNTFWATSRYQALQEQIVVFVNTYHRQFPLRLGMPREELRSRLSIKNALLTVLLDQHPYVVNHADLVQSHDHRIEFTETQEQQITKLEVQMVSTPITPPSYKEASDIVGEDVLRALIALDYIVQVSVDVIFSASVYEQMVEQILAMFDEQQAVDAKSVRDVLGTSRKYAIALLEHLDQLGLTKRVGDNRIRGHINK